jgi:hypothetical protein
MPRGGARPGAGRKKGSAHIKTREIANAAAAAGATPLNYMLSVLNDKSAEQARRDRMAECSAPYCHPRLNAVAATVDTPNAGGCVNLTIVAIPHGAQFNPATGLIVYPDGTETDAPPFRPYEPTPGLAELPAPVDTPVVEQLPVVEPEPVGDPTSLVVLDTFRRRRSGDDEPPAA